MLALTVVMNESWDESKEEFVRDEFELRLEHSLVSLSKWEEVFEKPFLGDGEMTDEETMAYIGFMIINDNFPPGVLSKLEDDHLNKVNEYINKKRSATWFKEDPNRSLNREVITSELIYYWMVALSIPFETQHWHFNRLLTLIRVCNEKNQPKKKMSPSEALAERRRLNAQRRAQYKTTG